MNSDEEKVDPTEQIKALIARYDEAIAQKKWENQLNEAWLKRVPEMEILERNRMGPDTPFESRPGGRGFQPNYVPIHRPWDNMIPRSGVRYFDPSAHVLLAQQGTDSVPAMLTPHEAVLNVGAADILGRDKIRMLNAMGERQMYQQGTEDANMMTNPLEYYFQLGTSDVPPFGTPEYKEWLINKIRSGTYDYTYGPASPGATPSDRRQLIGARDNPLRTGDIALPQRDYELFTPEERQQLRIADTSWIREGQPTPQGSVERYYGAPTTAAARGGGFEPMANPAFPVASAEPAKAEGFDYKSFGGSLSKIGQSYADQAEASIKQAQSEGMTLLNSSNPYINQDPLALIRSIMQFRGGG